MKNFIFFLFVVITFDHAMGQNPAMKVASNGNVGIGTANPQEKLHVINNGSNEVAKFESDACAAQILFDATGDGGGEWLFMSTSDCASLGGGKYTIFEQGKAHRFVISPNNGNIGIGTTSPQQKLHVNGVIKHSGLEGTSDKRLKKNIKSLDYGLDEILRINTYSYNWNGKAGLKSSSKPQFGVLAQEFQKIVPEAVSEWTYVDDKDDKTIAKDNGSQYLSIQTDALQYILVNAIQEQQGIIEDLQVQVSKLQELISTTTVGTSQGIKNIQLSDYSENDLFQNRPNPYRLETVIDYSVAQSATSAKMLFYNLQGQLIKTVNLQKGIGRLIVSTDDLPSGSYTYNLEIDGVIIGNKKMVKMR